MFTEAEHAALVADGRRLDFLAAQLSAERRVMLGLDDEGRISVIVCDAASGSLVTGSFGHTDGVRAALDALTATTRGSMS